MLDTSISEDGDGMKEVPLKPERPAEVGFDGGEQLTVGISDALSERDKVKFTVQTKTSLPAFSKSEVSVVRQHEEFIWLHNSLVDNVDYVAFIIPPAPPRPDFNASREKLQRLGEGEGNMTREEFNKMKQELEQEYLATFKKTVAMHETFLTRLASHAVFRCDTNFKVFLEYEKDLSVRGRSRRERLEDVMRSFGKATDQLLLQATQRDVDDFFENEKNFVLAYHEHIREATARADRMTHTRKQMADTYIKVSSALVQLGALECSQLDLYLHRVSDIYEHVRKTENRTASDEDLKLSDTMRYYMRDSTAVKGLLYRRLRCLADYEAANKNLEKARARNREVHAAEVAQQAACHNFELISDKAKEELMSFKKRRVAAFKKHLVSLTELEVVHAKSQLDILRNSLESLRSVQ